MPTREIEEFAKILVEHVRDGTIKRCDVLLRPQATAPIAKRWKEIAPSRRVVEEMIPDLVDRTVFALFSAIDEGLLPLKYVSAKGEEVDLCEDGLGELAGWYMGDGGFRERYSKQRAVDDFASLKKK